jgi:hypothetical protein
MRRILRVTLVLAALLALLSVGSVAQAHTQAFSINRNATLSPGGTLITVRGTFTCTAFHDFQLFVSVTQGDGQNQDFAGGSIQGLCTGGIQTWQVTAQGGPFHSGRAVASVQMVTGGPDGVENFQTDAVIRLS